ncbi:hypothetical protein [Ensifer adhaerens]|nr:hypothetical protein [Ensifer adhaerens]MBW0366127.1 hypothetical protein [Ensifer adhaerens]UCM19978.1 hypothetical protein LDL63_19580 [Ensifer adhaerens]
MLLLRILTLPMGLAAFALLYIAATKAPATVEVGSLLMWPVLAIALIVKASQRILQFATGR